MWILRRFRKFIKDVFSKEQKREIIGKLHDETVKALKLPDVNERLVKAGLLPVGNTPEEFTSVIRNEIEQFGKLAKELGIEPQ